MSGLLGNDSLVLFQGDSITDAGRDKNNPASLGWGYAMMVSSLFAAMHPHCPVRFVNRGISGNRVRDLPARWEQDCIALKPDWVSILIGINDMWRRYDSNDPTPVDRFEREYRDLLRITRERTRARLILLEPFLIHVRKEMEGWREDLDPKIQAVRRLAREFNALYIPLDGIFARVCAMREPTSWAGDGVHPSEAGHALIARHWLQAVGEWVG
jgi:lysophospholipase L1-like esterase